MKIEISPLVADAFRSRREELGLVQSELSSLSGVGISTIYALETGARSRFAVASVRALIEALHWPADALSTIRAGGVPVTQGPIVNAPATLSLEGLTATRNASFVRSLRTVRQRRPTRLYVSPGFTLSR